MTNFGMKRVSTGDKEQGMETPRNKGDAAISRDRGGTSKKEGIKMDFSYHQKNLTGRRTPGTWQSQITPPYRYFQS